LLKKLKPESEIDSAGINPAAKRDLDRENARKYLKHFPEGIDKKKLSGYDIIVAMEPKYKEIILSKCPQCADRIIVWNIADPYFLSHEEAEKVFKQIKSKIVKLTDKLQKNNIRLGSSWQKG